MENQYVITDGLKYLCLDKNRNVTYVTSPIYAEKYVYEKAINVKDNNLPTKDRDKFYISPYEERQGSKVNRKTKLSLIKTLPATPTEQILKGEKIEINLEEMIEQLDYLLDNIYVYKEQLLVEQQHTDLELSDIEHFIQEHAPAAHIRTKIYTKQRQKRLERERIKQNLKYTNIIIECINQGSGLTEIKNRLKGAEFQPYKARTEIYNELLEWIG